MLPEQKPSVADSKVEKENAKRRAVEKNNFAGEIRYSVTRFQRAFAAT